MDANDHAEGSGDGSISNNITLQQMFWGFYNDPVKAQIEAQIRDQIEAQQRGMSAQPRSGPRRYIDRDHAAANADVLANYFSENPLYNDKQFRRRYRMRRHLFLRIVDTLSDWSPYFCQRDDAFGKEGFSPLHKCTVALRMLAYGTPADLWDENFKIAETTVIECTNTFCRGVIEKFGPTYLRKPNREDIQRLLHVGEARGFPGMLGSVDCMHWRWRNCPTAWKGQFTRGDQSGPTIMLEAVASHDLWIWHAFFGIPGSNNDINVLNRSTLFTEVVHGRAPEVSFVVNGNEYKMGYYLADGIYPEWATFVKTIHLPQCAKDSCFSKHQEGARKDVERAFGVLQSRFAILRSPARPWQMKSLAEIMYTCIILHNMIVEDERDMYKVRHDDFYQYDEGRSSTPLIGYGHGPIQGFSQLLQKQEQIQDTEMHHRLKKDLVEHIFQRFGGVQGQALSGPHENI